MDLTIRQMRAFLAVADLGSFSRAAEQIGMAQPALSQQVRDLETKLDLRLFDRTTRRVDLTDGGREFRHAAIKILDDLERAVRQAGDRAGGQRGRVVIAAPPLLATAIFPQAIAEFATTHPLVAVTLVDVSTEQIIEQVRSGRADCGLGTFPPTAEGIERVQVARDNLMVFLAPGDTLRRRKAVAWSALRDRPLVTLRRESGIRLLVEIGFETAEIPLRPAYEVAQITTALALVKAGLGVAVLPAYARVATLSREILDRPLVAPSIVRDIDLIHGSGRTLSPAAKAFCNMIVRHMRRRLPHAPVH